MSKINIAGATELTTVVSMELADEHGSATAAKEFRQRQHVGEKPSDGSAVVQERTIVMNDMHIGIGRDPVTGNVYPGEDFTAEQERKLTGYLSAEWLAAAKGNEAMTGIDNRRLKTALKNLKWESGGDIDSTSIADLNSSGHKYKLNWVLNGDVFDFLQTKTERAHMRYPDGFCFNGKAPKNTPANAIAMLNMMREGHESVFKLMATHLRLGHNIEYVPGNHDRHLYNKHVWAGHAFVACGKEDRWSELCKTGDARKADLDLSMELRAMGASEEEVRQCMEGNMRPIPGFVPILRDELRKTGATEAEVTKALSHLTRRPFVIHGDSYTDHGDMSDAFNKIRRPYKEMIDPTGLHDEMEMAYGDYGVKIGFNDVEDSVPCLDNMVNGGASFWFKSFTHHFGKTLKLIGGFFKAATMGGYKIREESAAGDLAQRVSDVRAMVDLYPDIEEKINALRPDSEKLSKDQIKAGFEKMERKSATPLFSNVFEGEKLFFRFFTFVKKKLGMQHTDVNLVQRGGVANKELGLNTFIHGHTHTPVQKLYLSAEEREFIYLNTGSWMRRDHNHDGRERMTVKTDEYGVAVFEEGVGKDGKKFAHYSLMKVINEEGDLGVNDLPAAPTTEKVKRKKMAREIYGANRPVAESADMPPKLDRLPSGHVAEQRGKAQVA